MKKLLLISVLLGTASAASSAAAATSASGTAPTNALTTSLPAGALVTLETHHMGAAIDRFSGLIVKLLPFIGAGQNASDASGMLSAIKPALKGSLGDEGVLGVYSVGGRRGTYEPGLLAVMRVNADARALLRAGLPPASRQARVGAYTFARQDGLFVGMSNNLAYAASDKNLLMGYLGRLSGKAAPTLAQAGSYAVPMNAVGAQELRLFLNFSGISKVIRSQLATVGFPRLLAPVVDALDTLGQVGAGISTNAAGLSGASAQTANPNGADTTLYRLLTHKTDAFKVQSIVPADVEAVSVSACDPATNEYLARWITRLDLLDPTGFLSDTQLAHNLEVQGRYLGDECAQATLKGGTQAAILSKNALEPLNYSVSYRKLSDEAAARAHMQVFAPSVNRAIKASVKALKTQFRTLLADSGGMAQGAAASGLMDTLNATFDQYAALNYVYDIRDGYLVTAFSQKALNSAMKASSFLDGAPDFRAQNFTLSGGGFTLSRAPTPYRAQDLLSALKRQLSQNSMAALYNKETQAVLGPVASGLTNLLNRIGASSSQTSVNGNLMVTKTKIDFKW